MLKKTIELHRTKNFTMGYGYISHPVTEERILDELVKFSKDKEIKIYKHLVFDRDENIKNGICDRVTILKIYYQ